MFTCLTVVPKYIMNILRFEVSPPAYSMRRVFKLWVCFSLMDQPSLPRMQVKMFVLAWLISSANNTNFSLLVINHV